MEVVQQLEQVAIHGRQSGDSPSAPLSRDSYTALSVLFAYLDESYEIDVEYWLGACLIDESAAPGLRDDMNAVSAGLAPHGLRADVEMHAQHLFGGNETFEALKGSPRLRIAAYRDGVQAMANANAHSLLVGVGWCREPMRSAIRIHRMHAIEHMLITIEGYLLGAGETCLVIADEEEGTTRDVYRALQAHQKAASDSGVPSRIRDVLFVDSRYSPGVQGADLITFLHRRRKRPGNERRTQKALDDMYALIDAAVGVSLHPVPPAPSTSGTAARIETAG
jgi:hypothetical protein